MSTAKPRSGLPELWAKNLASVVAGDNVCEFAPWFKARHQRYTKVKGDFDIKAWEVEHKAMLDKKVAELIAEGYKPHAITLENQNRFVLKGSTVKIAGKIDILARHPSGRIRIWDAKTGRPRPTDTVQMAIYVWALPRAWKTPGLFVEGSVYYPEQIVHVSPDDANQVMPRVFEMARKLGEGSPTPAPRPSQSECSFCDISEADCPLRWKGEPEAVAEVTEF